MGRIKSYITAWNPRSKFTFDKVPTNDALERFRAGETRSFEIEVASPVNLPAVEGDDGAADRTVVEATRMLAAAFEGLTVTVTVSMGRKPGELPKGPIQMVLDRFLPWNRANLVDVRKLRVKSKEDIDGGESEYISFLDEFLTEKDVTDLPDANPQRNYELRARFIRLWHNQNLPYLTHIYIQ